jgi:N-sulfoglucosamine sulfohydrolase
VPHRVQSWDGEVVLLGTAKPGDERPASEVWNVYDGEVISLQQGDTLHVNAMRIGYKPALIDYIDGKVTVRQAP